ncbi:mannose-6-phosphate isomerase [Planctomycetales bacterium ZRK34]|nr:mannose-6-phosphate isomerase [Planctomycetales bacterium ZRK34]
MPCRKSNYDKFPAVHLSNAAANMVTGYPAIIQRLTETLADRSAGRQTLVVDTYPGVDDHELLDALVEGLKPDRVINTLDLKKSEAQTLAMLDRYLTDDRIFGVMSCHQLEEFFDVDQLAAAQRTAETWSGGLLLVYGVGAALVMPGDVLVYADLARWEIQLRYRRGIGNWGADNGDEDFFRKYKRSYFVEWRVADRHKFSIFDQFDFLLDTNQVNEPKLLAAETVHDGLRRAASQPFRVVPFFDPAPWGGQWMKQVCDLDRDAANFGWCFDCVPEENSLAFDIDGARVEMPSLNLVYRHPVELLGDKVHARFGREFPIRFDFLDTIGGGNLSFQVHPLTEYIQQTFGMHYTQDESYYLLDAGLDATVYLGLKDGIDRDQMVRDLHTAQASADQPFPAEKYVNRWPAKKHDHFLIPAGTVHCSGADAMVLEISATPYIFTFKMWDWGRLGLDSRPRPVHLQHAVPNIQWDRTTDWVQQQLIDQVQDLAEGDGWREQRTGLHTREFIETRRHWFTGRVPHNTDGGVNVLNLIDGEQAIVESPSDAFKPFIVHYAETFIVPASVGAYTIRPHGLAEGTQCATLKAFIRT